MGLVFSISDCFTNNISCSNKLSVEKILTCTKLALHILLLSATACAFYSKFVKMLLAQVWSDNFTNFLNLIFGGFLPFGPSVRQYTDVEIVSASFVTDNQVKWHTMWSLFLWSRIYFLRLTRLVQVSLTTYLPFQFSKSTG